MDGSPVSRVLVVSGAGAYSDPWHPFAETSDRLAGLLAPEHDVTITTDVVETLTALDAGDWDLVVLNFGSGGVEVPTDAACVEGLERYTGAGGALLACHVVATAFPAEPRWEDLLGGRWVRGTTMHPPQSDAHIHVVSGHAITDGHADFDLFDERYTYLRLSPDVDVLATHEHQGERYPLMWAREDGAARVVYDGLGHDGRSFDSADHVALVHAAVRWLLRA